MKALVALLILPVVGALAQDKVDLEVVHRIKTEAFTSSQVMDHLFYLTDVNGPRLTGSPGFESAAKWVKNRAESWGLANVKLEPWGPFGRGWSFSRFELHLQKPVYAPLHGIPLAWCDGTDGSVTAQVVAAPFPPDGEKLREMDLATIRERVAEYSALWRGKLRGKIVLLGSAREFTPATEAPTKRLDSPELTSISNAPELSPGAPADWVPDKLPKDAKKRAALLRNLPLAMDEDYWHRRQAAGRTLNAFLREEGVVAALKVDTRGAGGLLFAEAAGSYETNSPGTPPMVVVAPEQYNRLWRLVEKDIPVEISLDLKVRFVDSPTIANVVAEIPGGKKKEEIVMLGAHLDSWHAGTGATDNAAGSAVMLEAMRILQSLHLSMDRTVRLVLWSGEEQGLCGSRAYVQEHFGDMRTLQTKPEHARLAAYFNVDNGSGKIRGVHLQGNDMVRPIFEAWLAPFKDLGASTITLRDTGGTDHLSFDAVGLPGFQFIQDPLDYGSRTHHSDLDVYDHVEPGDLMQASAIVASFVYNAATREERLPRKPLPKPLPAKASKVTANP